MSTIGKQFHHEGHEEREGQSLSGLSAQRRLEQFSLDSGLFRMKRTNHKYDRITRTREADSCGKLQHVLASTFFVT